MVKRIIGGVCTIFGIILLCCPGKVNAVLLFLNIDEKTVIMELETLLFIGLNFFIYLFIIYLIYVGILMLKNKAVL